MIPIARPMLGEKEIAAAVAVLRSGQVVQGREVAALEEEFAGLVAGRHCVAVSSGTSALWLPLLALGIGPGDEVIVPSFSFAATAGVVALAGAVPVFADIDPATFCLDPAGVAAAVTPRTAAIIAVHLYGHPAPMSSLLPLAARHGLAVVEDAAQAHGAALGGRPAGSFGAAAAFSFYPTKNMATIEGGLISVPDEATARRLRLLRNQGMDGTSYQHEVIGANARMSDVAAAIARQQLLRLDDFTRARQANAAALTAALGGVVACPHPALGARHVYHQYTITVPGGPAARDALASALRESGVGSRVYYPVPIHRMQAFASYKAPGLPVTDAAAGGVLSLPVHPALARGDVARVAAAVRSALGRSSR
ncbi:MAG TPA: aminotransferase class I/II-fold pyridoxal phosphate-dependent enzyme [Trebonia sp.]|nr:aminotransferase class I/II-fold pyridoxal phosphate-dependent enzyme [Trebonia sp.]